MSTSEIPLTLPPNVEYYGNVADIYFNQHDQVADGRFQILDDTPVKSSPLADVYRARHNELESNVALKVFKEPNHVIRRLVDRELMAHIALNGFGGIVKTLDMGIMHERKLSQRYLATELYDLTLERFINNSTPSKDSIKSMATQIMWGVEATHQHGLVHKDIKPANILGNQAGTEWVLTDFGLVDVTGDTINGLASYGPADIWDKETTISTPGTPGFIAPELLKSCDISPKVDIYSFGMTVINMATGKLAFQADKTKCFATCIATESPAQIEALMNSAPAKLGQLAIECIQEDPNERPDYKQIEEVLSSI